MFFLNVSPNFQFQNEIKKSQPTRASLPRKFQSKTASCWLGKYFSFQYGKWGGTVKNHLVYCLTIAPDLIAARRGACVWMRRPSLVQMVVSVSGDDARLEGLGIVAAFKVIRLPGGIVKNL